MLVPIQLWRDFSAPQLRSLAKKSKDGPQARRNQVFEKLAPQTLCMPSLTGVANASHPAECHIDNAAIAEVARILDQGHGF